MRALIINYAMDDNSDVLAWQAGVACRIARLCEYVLVLTDRLGEHKATDNMKVELFPRRPFGIPRKAGGAWLMNLPVSQLCRRYSIDVCFVHMVHPWVCYLWPCFRQLEIPILLWYAHGSLPRDLYRALKYADRVVTSTPEGFRIPSTKVHVIGQGINTDLFVIPKFEQDRNEMVYVGRISRRKRIDLLLEVMSSVRKISPDSNIKLRIIGPAITKNDLEYQEQIQAAIKKKGLHRIIKMAGFIAQKEIPRFYRSAFLHINVSDTGSMDKTVNEALSCGCPTLTSNPAFRELLSAYPELIITDERPEVIARQVTEIYANRAFYNPQELRQLIVGKHDMDSYAQKIVSNLEQIISESGR